MVFCMKVIASFATMYTNERKQQTLTRSIVVINNYTFSHV